MLLHVVDSAISRHISDINLVLPRHNPNLNERSIRMRIENKDHIRINRYKDKFDLQFEVWFTIIPGGILVRTVHYNKDRLPISLVRHEIKDIHVFLTERLEKAKMQFDPNWHVKHV